MVWEKGCPPSLSVWVLAPDQNEDSDTPVNGLFLKIFVILLLLLFFFGNEWTKVSKMGKRNSCTGRLVGPTYVLFCFIILFKLINLICKSYQCDNYSS